MTRVAAAQIACRDSDVAANLELHLTIIDAARRRDTDLLLFPELSLTGYRGATELLAAGTLPGAADLHRLAAAAGPMTVSVGLPERSADGSTYNTQVALRAGAIVHRHRKLNLPTYGALDEGRHFAKGDRIETFLLDDRWRVATLICADTWNPALPWLAALGGADLLLVPVASTMGAVDASFDSARGWEVNLHHTALHYGLAVVMANHAGGAFWGGSRILGPDGAELARAGDGPGLIGAEITLESVRRARHTLPTMRDADPRLIRDALDLWLGATGAGSVSRDGALSARSTIRRT